MSYYGHWSKKDAEYEVWEYVPETDTWYFVEYCYGEGDADWWWLGGYEVVPTGYYFYPGDL